MAEKIQHIRIGMADNEVYCLGFKPPIPEEIIKQFSCDGLKPGLEMNPDSSQTVGYNRRQFGWTESDRWNHFEIFAENVAKIVAKNVIAEKVTLDLEPRMMEYGETSLFAKHRVKA